MAEPAERSEYAHRMHPCADEKLKKQAGGGISSLAFLPLLPLLALCAGCSEKPKAAPEPRLVNVVRVSAGSANTNDVGYSGEIRPRYETNLSFRVAGKIVARNVEVGGTVKKDDVLARLDPEDQQLNTRSAQSQLAAAKSEYEQNKAELERYTGLYEKEFISKAEFDRRQSSYNVAKARLEQAQAQLAVTKNQTGYTELAADHAGVVTAIPIEVGQVVAAGQTIMKLARTDDREVVISIPENRLSELSAATEIDISLWADPSKIYKGKLRELSPSADPVTRTYAAKISVRNADAAIKLGMTANVYLRGVQRSAAIMLPATALFQDNGHAAVWIVDKTNSQVKLVPVEVGEYVEDRVGILAGIAPGDTVVRAGVHKLFAGEKVRTHEEPAHEAAK
jgi:multidrug efflux system membrane fusion protein